MRKIISILLFCLIFQTVFSAKKVIKRSGKFGKLFEKIASKDKSLRKLQGTDGGVQDTSEATLPGTVEFVPPAENQPESGSALAENGEVPISSPVSKRIGYKRNNRNAPVQINKFYGFKPQNSNGIGLFFFKILFFFTRKIPKFIIFRLRITYIARLRNLELGDKDTAESVRSDCTIQNEDLAGTENSDGEDVSFKCEAKSTGNINNAKVEVNTDVNMQFVNPDNSIEEVGFENVNFNGNSADEASSLQSSTEDFTALVMFKKATVSILEKNYLIFTGKTSSIGRRRLQTGDVYEMNLTNTDGEKQTYDCTLTEGSSAQLNCDLSKKSLTTTTNLLDTSTGYQKENPENALIVGMDSPDDEQITVGSSDSRYNYNKSSSGLSGGAIAGIVIACVVAIIAAAIAVIMLRKPAAPIDASATVANLKTDNL